jgi:glutamate-ammonia-ligase adenylyltransferase
VSLLAEDEQLRPRSRSHLELEFRSTASRHEPAGDGVRAIRDLRRRELFRISAADLLGSLAVDEVGSALSDVARATLSAALESVTAEAVASRGRPVPCRIAAIGMGRLGGNELGYGSDVDVVFVHDPLPGEDGTEAAAAATAIVGRLRTLLQVASTDPPLELDVDLRPEGRQGLLVPSLLGYRCHFHRWGATWEAQALLRADFVAGDPGLWQKLRATIDPIRWPAGGLSQEQVREIRILKARMETERLPRGTDPHLNTKLGRGGLSDVEWVVQLIQMQFAGREPTLRTTSTMAALDSAREAGLIGAEDATVLADAWRLATRMRNAAMLVLGRASDLVDPHPRGAAPVARLMGYPRSGTGDMLEDYRRTTRRARSVTERVFYGH